MNALRWLRDLWRDDWAHVGERLDALRRIQALADPCGPRTAPKARPVRYQLGTPRSLAEWLRRHGGRKTA